MIRATFSENNINLLLPKSWSELDDDELRAVFDVLALLDDGKEDVRFWVLKALVGLNVIRNRRRGISYLCTIRTDVGKVMFWLTPNMLASALEELDWIYEFGDKVVRLSTMRGCRAVDPDLHGVPFGVFLQVENLYQGFLQSMNPEALSSIAALLYSDFPARTELDDIEVFNILRWMVQLKQLFASAFTNFFKPSSGGSDGEVNMLDVMNNEIRALTGGDVTKEDDILAIDTWRALTELDFKAQEAAAMKSEINKHKI